MSIEQVYANNVQTDYIISTPNYQPEHHSVGTSDYQPANNYESFSDILAGAYDLPDNNQNQCQLHLQHNEYTQNKEYSPLNEYPTNEYQAEGYLPYEDYSHPANMIYPENSADAIYPADVIYPVDAIYPAALAAETKPTGAFNIDNYFPIAETEVISSLRSVRNIINDAELSGKTDIEKFDWIEAQFIELFGEDFMMARNLSLPSSMFYLIGVEFTDTLNRLFDNPGEVNRMRLHGDKSTEEIMNLIREQFPEELSNRDLLLMVNEKRSLGLLDSDSLRTMGEENARNLIDTLGLLKSYIQLSIRQPDEMDTTFTFEERDRRWIELLSQAASANDMKRMFNAWVMHGKEVSEEAARFIENVLGGVRGPDGLFIINEDTGGSYGEFGGIFTGRFIPPAREEPDWASLLNLILNGMQEHEDFIRDRMRMIDEYPQPDSIIRDYNNSINNSDTTHNSAPEHHNTNPVDNETEYTGTNTANAESNGAEENTLI